MGQRAGPVGMFLVGVSSMAFGGCGGSDEPAGLGDAAQRVSAVQRDVDYRLYCVGPRFEGLPLTAVARDPEMATFSYGSAR